MSQIVQVRKGNADNSTILTIPKPIANLLNIKVGTFLEMSQTAPDRFELKVIR